MALATKLWQKRTCWKSRLAPPRCLFEPWLLAAGWLAWQAGGDSFSRFDLYLDRCGDSLCHHQPAFRGRELKLLLPIYDRARFQQDRCNAPIWQRSFPAVEDRYFPEKILSEQSPFDEVSMGIAHELSHLVLDYIKHPLRRCEKAVDLTAMMLGFRCLFATGTYKEIKLKDHIEVRQHGYLSPEEVRRADRIIEQYQDTSRPKQPQTEETIDRTSQVQIRLAQLRYLVARLSLREHLNNLMSKWRPSAVGLLSVLFILIASWLIWANGWLPPRETSRRSADQTETINLPPNKTDLPGQQRQTSKTEETVDGIRRVQIRLVQLGYLVAKPDGQWGPKSRAALKSFKDANGLIVNDLLDLGTLSALFSSSAMAVPVASAANSRK